MDVDNEPCGSDNFYDEIASFMPQPNDYTLDDLDEILRTADSELDSSLDFSSLLASNNVNDFNVDAFGSFRQPIHEEYGSEDNIDLCTFTNATYSTINPQPGFRPPSESAQSQRRFSISSMGDGDNLNSKDFVNFFAEDDNKTKGVPAQAYHNVVDDIPLRSTPSPTGSCSSSGGSSTSGVQSDVSSVLSIPETNITKMLTPKIVEHCNELQMMTGFSSIPSASPTLTATETLANSFTTTQQHSVLPITLPVLPLQTPSSAATATAILQPLTQVQPFTLIPVKALPISNVPQPKTPPCTGKVEPKLAPKLLHTSVSIQQSPNTISVTSPTVTPSLTSSTISKMSPPNAKPKTIFLSSKDFKALMQKMNSNDSLARSADKVPKIVMKAPNGKIVTANKLVQSNSVMSIPSKQQHQNFLPKIIKTNGIALGSKSVQHITKVSAVSSAGTMAAKNNGSICSSSLPDINIYKGIVDDKMYKKQQRMIKNRESASLSRKKKKEYVVSLETRINNLEKENYTLKGENTSLRSQLLAFAQTCQCKHSNVSEFILNSLNLNSKQNNVKIAPKPIQKSLKQRMSAASVRKNVAVLFAMAFMVTLNVGNFQTYFNKNSIESSIEAAANEAAAATTAAGTSDSIAAPRQLVWVESEKEFQQKLHRSKRETELEVPPPPLHFLRPINRTQTRGNGTVKAEIPNCGNSMTNQTEENIRLVNKLHKWIDGNDYLNLSLHEKVVNDNNSVGFKLSPEYFALNEIDVQTGVSEEGGTNAKRKILMPVQYESKQRRIDRHVQNFKRDAGDKSNSEGNSLDLFKPKLSDEYVRLFRGIRRQDDTFYVLSFNMDHILLPASVYNKSARPKMSLMLPAGDPSLNGDIVLMQIDCEVVNTTELKLTSDMIPERLRPSKYKSSTMSQTADANSTDVASNDTAPTERGKVQSASFESTTVHGKDKLDTPLPRTYFMMGPKTQAAMKRKPTILKLSSKDNVTAIHSVNVKNSTLFARMRETVEMEGMA